MRGAWWSSRITLKNWFNPASRGVELCRKTNLRFPIWTFSRCSVTDRGKQILSITQIALGQVQGLNSCRQRFHPSARIRRYGLSQNSMLNLPWIGHLRLYAPKHLKVWSFPQMSFSTCSNKDQVVSSLLVSKAYSAQSLPMMTQILNLQGRSMTWRIVLIITRWHRWVRQK